MLLDLFDIFLILYIPDTNLIILKLTEREEISYKNTQRNLILMAPWNRLPRTFQKYFLRNKKKLN